MDEQYKQEDYYEIHEDGPLTYFCCYIDEFAPQPHLLSAEQPSLAKPVLFKPVMAGILGTGLAATALVGFAVAHHSSQSKGQETQPISRKQSPKSSLINQNQARSQVGLSTSTPEIIDKNPFSSTRSGALIEVAQSTLRPSSNPTGIALVENSAKKPNTTLERKPFMVSLPETLPASPIVSSSLLEQNQAVPKAPTPITREKIPALIVSRATEASSSSISTIVVEGTSPSMTNQIKQPITQTLATTQPTALDTTSVQPKPLQSTVVEINRAEPVQAEVTQESINELLNGTKSSLKPHHKPLDASETLPQVSLSKPLLLSSGKAARQF